MVQIFSAPKRVYHHNTRSPYLCPTLLPPTPHPLSHPLPYRPLCLVLTPESCQSGVWSCGENSASPAEIL